MLAKKFRLPIQNWFKEKKGAIVRKSDFFAVKTRESNLPFSRYGVVVSRKVSGFAVRRNKIKRIIFNFIRLEKLQETSGRDVLIIVSPLASKLTKQKIETELKSLLTANR
ncbi:MAG: Ribonuclease P protein component [Candidatus Wolfebacteria bacterium GW2011_GWA2_42_10]|uniref:Ribonuclease P protein component n=2 Tax=Candidatus Wolfeibacteriota TaxID=1752735 RepID=A0A0G1AJ53_9BACT|nr:MAG: Ribonuclease P protein component [Candidatus Wolfebacteria bacterium GW2011_GWB1_41_12]KKS25318.1 MAG: Ribonuclease P protein component [Candidatus Wolfebacteria bacterium GW2011_GWA2_42_10]KKT56757.1 MAG: Ribonuclease P protein component [Candidatus Wolfebacteria bacterium GW2011_GWA1_44_24]